MELRLSLTQRFAKEAELIKTSFTDVNCETTRIEGSQDRVSQIVVTQCDPG